MEQKEKKVLGWVLPLQNRLWKSIKVRSGFIRKRGKGTEFHFTVPSSANTVLIIIEDETLRNEYEKIITESYPSFKIMCAANGFEALGLISTYMPSLI